MVKLKSQAGVPYMLSLVEAMAGPILGRLVYYEVPYKIKHTEEGQNQKFL